MPAGVRYGEAFRAAAEVAGAKDAWVCIEAFGDDDVRLRGRLGVTHRRSTP